MTQTQTTVDITESAMLVDLNIHQWSARKHDKTVSDEVATQHGSSPDMGRFNKMLMSSDSLERVRRAAAKMRVEHYKRTLPWSDEGPRILSSTGYFDYTEKMRELQDEFTAAYEDFRLEYPTHKETAKKVLNGLYREDDYPALHKLDRKFYARIAVLPMPTAEDFRVKTLGTAETENIRKQIEQQMRDSLETAMADVWSRMREVISHMAERLRTYAIVDDKVVNTFRDSLVSNIETLLDLLPSLNITNDPNINAFAERMREELCANPAEVLRCDTNVRNETAAAAEDILRQMEDFI